MNCELFADVSKMQAIQAVTCAEGSLEGALILLSSRLLMAEAFIESVSNRPDFEEFKTEREIEMREWLASNA